MPSNDPVLMLFRAAVERAYGERVDRVVLFGSRARGDHRPDSDYDLAVFVRDMGSLWDELGTLAAISTDLKEETGAMISAKPFPPEAWQSDSRLLHTMRDEGVEL